MKHSRKNRGKKTLKLNKRSINKRAGAIVKALESSVEGVINLVGNTVEVGNTALKTTNSIVGLPGKVVDATGKIVDATGNTGAIVVDTVGEVTKATGDTGVEGLKTSSKLLRATGEVFEVSGEAASKNLEEGAKLTAEGLSQSRNVVSRVGDVGDTALVGTNQTLGGVFSMVPTILGSISTALKQSTDLVAHTGSEIVITTKDIISLPVAIIRFPILALKKVFDTLNAKLTTTTNPQEIQAIKEDQSKIIAEIAKTEKKAEETEKQLIENPETSTIKPDEPSKITNDLAVSTGTVVNDLDGELQTDDGKAALNELAIVADKLEQKRDELETREAQLEQIKQGGKRTRKNRKNSTRNKSKK
uniref:Uncharacterized protein n=1 Tax=viral metagenome TaxID=1070528 RepID=A0A6C0JYY0_9ZZZZ